MTVQEFRTLLRAGNVWDFRRADSEFLTPPEWCKILAMEGKPAESVVAHARNERPKIPFSEESSD
jgi:hypothetical protein